MQFSKELLNGTLELVVLETLSHGQSYAYELIQNINLKTAGAFELKESTVYTLLYRLEGQGMVYSSFKSMVRSKPRRYYKLTEDGKTRLKEKFAEYTLFSKAMKGILSSYAGAHA
jgi:PadR family transcriptional regulator PadR